MDEKKNRFRYSSPLQPKKLTLFRKNKERTPDDEDVFEQISKILDDSDLSTQDTKDIAEVEKNNNFEEKMNDVGFFKNSKSFSTSKIDENEINDVNLKSVDQDISLQPISNDSCTDRQPKVTKELKHQNLREKDSLNECSKKKIILNKEDELLNNKLESKKIEDISKDSRTNRMTPFDVCNLVFGQFKHSDDKITELKKKLKKYKLKIKYYQEQASIHEKNKEDLIKEKENIKNEKTLSDEKYEIVSDTYSSYRSDVTILIDSLRNNLDKINEERNSLYNKNIEMVSETALYKNKIGHYDIQKSKIKEVGFEILQEINNNYFNSYQCIDSMKFYRQECDVLYTTKNKCFVLSFLGKINALGIQNLLNEAFISAEDLFATFNAKLSSFYSLCEENKNCLTEKYNELNYRTVGELNAKIMEKNRCIEEYQDIYKNEIVKHEKTVQKMKEEFEQELRSHEITIEELRNKKKSQSLINFVECLNLIISTINEAQRDFFLVQKDLKNIKMHENNIKKSKDLKNKIKYKNLKEKYQKLKNKRVKKVSYPSESDIWDVFK